MSSLVKTRIAALLLGAAIVSGPLTASAQEGPRPSSVHNWPAPNQVLDSNATNGGYGAPDVSPNDPVFRQQRMNAADPVFDGPRPSPNH